MAFTGIVPPSIEKQDAVTAANTQLLNSTSSCLRDRELRSFDMKSRVVTHGTVSLEEHILTANDRTQKDGAYGCVKVKHEKEPR